MAASGWATFFSIVACFMLWPGLPHDIEQRLGRIEDAVSADCPEPGPDTRYAIVAMPGNESYAAPLAGSELAPAKCWTVAP